MRSRIFNRYGTTRIAESATDGRTSKLHKLRTLHLFAGAGGGILGDLLLGHQPVCAVEIEPYCQQVLHARQQDGILPWFPIFADVKEFDGKPWRGLVDVVCGGFPCQDISAAGKGAGLEGERSGLWADMRRVIGEVRPRYAFIENSPMLTIRGLNRVLADIAALGMDARWGVFCSCQHSLLHHRKRIFILAHAATDRRGFLQDDSRIKQSGRSSNSSNNGTYPTQWQTLPAAEFCGSTDELASWVQPGWKAIGNGQVPAVAALAWETLIP